MNITINNYGVMNASYTSSEMPNYCASCSGEIEKGHHHLRGLDLSSQYKKMTTPKDEEFTPSYHMTQGINKDYQKLHPIGNSITAMYEMSR